jgi:hypothetical protein
LKSFHMISSYIFTVTASNNYLENIFKISLETLASTRFQNFLLNKFSL